MQSGAGTAQPHCTYFECASTYPFQYNTKCNIKYTCTLEGSKPSLLINPEERRCVIKSSCLVGAAVGTVRLNFVTDEGCSHQKSTLQAVYFYVTSSHIKWLLYQPRIIQDLDLLVLVVCFFRCGLLPTNFESCPLPRIFLFFFLSFFFSRFVSCFSLKPIFCHF